MEDHEGASMGETGVGKFNFSDIDVPPQGPSFTSNSHRIDVLEQRLRVQEQKQMEREQKITALQVVSLGLSVRELVICASEIWKWSVQKKGSATGEGKKLFDPDVQELVVGGAIAMEMQHQIPEMQEKSQTCIASRDDTAHFSTLKSLEDAVELSLSVMKIFPSLLESHLHQCSTVSHYQHFKRLLPESFKDY